MNFTKLKRLMSGGALAFALAVGLVAIAGAPAQAQHRDDGYGGYGRGGYGNGNDVYRLAYDNGYIQQRSLARAGSQPPEASLRSD